MINVWAILFRPCVRYNVRDGVTKWKHFPRYWPSAPEQTVKQTIDAQVIWDAMALIMTSL